MSTRTKRRPPRQRSRSGFHWWLLAVFIAWGNYKKEQRRSNPYARPKSPRRAGTPRGATGGRRPVGTGGGADPRIPKTTARPSKPSKPAVPTGARRAPVDTNKKHGPDIQTVEGTWENGTDEQPPDDDFATTSDDPDFEWDPEVVDEEGEEDFIDVEVPDESKAIGNEYTWM